jgi:6-phosphogluconolactonase
MMTQSDITTHSFTDCQAQASALAECIAERLREGLAARGQAVLAVSGGSTPKVFFEHLSREKLDWSKVRITLVDERWVAENDPRSNAGMVKSCLMQHEASAATFVPLYAPTATPEDGLHEVTERIVALPQPFDAIVLGMGEDGHTASFFPGGDHLNDALDPQGSALLWPMRAPGAGEPRITLSLSALLRSHALFLLITGFAKRDLLADARLGLGAARHYPIRAVLTQSRMPVSVYWCP